MAILGLSLHLNLRLASSHLALPAPSAVLFFIFSKKHLEHSIQNILGDGPMPWLFLPRLPLNPHPKKAF